MFVKAWHGVFWVFSLTATSYQNKLKRVIYIISSSLPWKRCLYCRFPQHRLHSQPCTFYTWTLFLTGSTISRYILSWSCPLKSDYGKPEWFKGYLLIGLAIFNFIPCTRILYLCTMHKWQVQLKIPDWGGRRGYLKGALNSLQHIFAPLSFMYKGTVRNFQLVLYIFLKVELTYTVIRFRLN